MTRATDFILSLFAITMLFPIFMPIMLALRITGEGEVFYRQQRIGRGNKSFSVLKFATMKKDSPSIGTGTITVKDDPRVLPFGRFLRKTKINELPQLFNIFCGQMSLIGPRPLTEEIFAMYTREGQKQIGTLRPGLSGIGSIFFRSEDRFLPGEKDSRLFYRENIAPYKEALELWYVGHVSYYMYWKLIVFTLIAVCFPNSFRIHKYIKNLPEIPLTLAERPYGSK